MYIFDRYGKLLKQLDPLSEGWDGTYIGKPMPATDYWFRDYLEDGREFKGHFSLVRLKRETLIFKCAKKTINSITFFVAALTSGYSQLGKTTLYSTHSRSRC